MGNEKRRFDFVRLYDPAALLRILEAELPQTIAVVLSNIDTAKASLLLENLPHEIQGEVARKICCMGLIREDIIKKVEVFLKNKLSLADNIAENLHGGVQDFVDMLSLTDISCKKHIIECLENDDPELAEEVKKRIETVRSELNGIEG